MKELKLQLTQGNKNIKHLTKTIETPSMTLHGFK